MVRPCFLTLAAVFLVQFSLVYRFRLSATGVISLLFGVAFVAYYLRERRGASDAERSRTLVSAFVVFTVGVTVWVGAQLLSTYVL